MKRIFRQGSKADILVQKRRNVSHLDRQTSTNHQYAALGSAYDSGGILFEGDYSFDSPMHSLSLASPSPPGDIEARSGHTDVDMVERENSATASNQAKTSTNFLPRQLKHTSLIRSGLASTVPLNPSPLYHSERFLSSSTGSKSSGGNPSSSPSTEEPTPRKDVSPMHSDQQSSNSNSPASSQTPTNRIRPQYTIKIKDSPLQYTRTPSPSPLPSSPSATHEDERKLHYSPGLSQTAFPGGKHMLRYTMGYRDDCVSCQNKSESSAFVAMNAFLIDYITAAGHYGHVLHR
jgi:hypothetical protein